LTRQTHFDEAKAVKKIEKLQGELAKYWRWDSKTRSLGMQHRNSDETGPTKDLMDKLFDQARALKKRKVRGKNNSHEDKEENPLKKKEDATKVLTIDFFTAGNGARFLENGIPSELDEWRENSNDRNDEPWRKAVEKRIDLLLYILRARCVSDASKNQESGGPAECGKLMMEIFYGGEDKKIPYSYSSASSFDSSADPKTLPALTPGQVLEILPRQMQGHLLDLVEKYEAVYAPLRQLLAIAVQDIKLEINALKLETNRKELEIKAKQRKINAQKLKLAKIKANKIDLNTALLDVRALGGNEHNLPSDDNDDPQDEELKEEEEKEKKKLLHRADKVIVLLTRLRRVITELLVRNIGDAVRQYSKYRDLCVEVARLEKDNSSNTNKGGKNTSNPEGIVMTKTEIEGKNNDGNKNTEMEIVIDKTKSAEIVNQEESRSNSFLANYRKNVVAKFMAKNVDFAKETPEFFAQLKQFWFVPEQILLDALKYRHSDSGTGSSNGQVEMLGSGIRSLLKKWHDEALVAANFGPLYSDWNWAMPTRREPYIQEIVEQEEIVYSSDEEDEDVESGDEDRPKKDRPK